VNRSLGPLLLLLVVVAACETLVHGEAQARREFDGAAAFRHLERLVAIGPRPAGSAEGARARAYIEAELRAAGVDTRVLPFEAVTPHGRLPMANVIGVLPGKRPDVILIGGHYDTKWFPDIRFVGANDGGSSTALLLQLARELSKTPHELTYWITFFDGEEARLAWTSADSLYGSRHLAAELTRTRRLPRAMILVDMIGDRDLQIMRESQSTPWLTEAIWGAAKRLKRREFIDEEMLIEDDHMEFLKAGVPAVDIIDLDYPAWHTPKDTLDKVSAKSLQIVADVLLDALPDIEKRLVNAK